MDFIIKNASVISMAEDDEIDSNCSIVVRDGIITALGREPINEHPERVIDGTNLVIMPGLINGHTHSPESLAKGISDRSTLTAWLKKIWMPLDELKPRQIYIATLLCAAEMLRTGTVSLVDHFRQTPMTPEAVEAVAKAYSKSGLRVVIALMLRDIRQYESQTLLPAPDQLALVAKAHRQFSDPDQKCIFENIRIGVGPSGPTRCSDDLLEGAGEISTRLGINFHVHVDENHQEAEEAKNRYGMTATQHLHQLGLLNPSLSIAHGVWLSNADIELLAEAGSTVVHNPVSNMRLGSGIAPLSTLLSREVPVALGTDGAASNDGQSMLETLKTAVLLQRVGGCKQEHWMTAKEAVSLATTVPAKSFGFHNGQIGIGKKADFIAIKKSGYSFTPQNDWYRQIVFGANGLDVRYVVVAGKILLEDGRITTFDEDAILAEAREIGREIFNYN
jgi:cytosine/adenosine deaminase-related metal-dependent hydrolase